MNQVAFRNPPPPPAPPPERSVKGDEWRSAFGRFWSPKDWRRLQRLGLMQLDAKLSGHEVSTILTSYRSLVEDSVWRALFAGWIAGIVFGGFAL